MSRPLKDPAYFLQRLTARLRKEEVHGRQDECPRHSVDDVRPVADVVEADGRDLRDDEVEKPMCLRLSVRNILT